MKMEPVKLSREADLDLLDMFSSLSSYDKTLSCFEQSLADHQRGLFLRYSEKKNIPE